MIGDTKLADVIKSISDDIKSHNDVIKRSTVDKIAARLEAFVEEAGTELLSLEMAETDSGLLAGVLQQFDNFESICESLVGQLEDIEVSAVDIEGQRKAIGELKAKIQAKKEIMEKNEELKMEIAGQKKELETLDQVKDVEREVDRLKKTLDAARLEVLDKKSLLQNRQAEAER